MKKNITYIIYFFLSAMLIAGCKEENHYPGGRVSPYFSIYDLRTLYKGEDLVLSVENMLGSDSLAAVVVSDHSGGNLPEGLLVVQDKRRLNQLRGISIDIGAAAADFTPGDSVNIKVTGGTLKRVNGLLQIEGIPAGNIRKVRSNIEIPPNRVPSSFILANPDKYESTLVAIVKGGFDPLPQPSDNLLGDKLLNDGFDNITLHTEASASFASKDKLPVVGNWFGIVFQQQQAEGTIPEIRLRTAEDITYLSSEVEITPIVVSGFLADAAGTDGNYEYIQLMATRDIDFAAENFSVVTTNNAGTTNPSGTPSLGWATGSLATSGNSRTYKFNLTSGTVKKGEFFYVGGSSKKINGSQSTSISSANWIRSFTYSSINGDGFGLKTGNLLANSGNASGIAVFRGTDVTVDSKPVDVIFIGGGGNLLNPGPPAEGYKICNTDFYDVIDPITLESQPYYKAGSNTLSFNYLSGAAGYFHKLGGIYNPRLGKWVKARTQTGVPLNNSSTLEEIEGIFPAPGTNGPDDPGTPPTSLKN